jgi:hypothetical protein
MALLNIGYRSSTATVRDFEILSEEFNLEHIGQLEFFPQIKLNITTTATLLLILLLLMMILLIPVEYEYCNSYSCLLTDAVIQSK